MNIDHVVVPSVVLHPLCHFSYFAWKAQIGVQFFYPNPVLTWHMVTPGIATQPGQRPWVGTTEKNRKLATLKAVYYTKCT